MSEQQIQAADLSFRGTALTDEEAASVVAVLAQLAGTEPQSLNDSGGTGPTDRTTQRKHRLAVNDHGLWGRPGPNSWHQATGGM